MIAALLLIIVVLSAAFIAWRRGRNRAVQADAVYNSIARLASRVGFGPRPNETVYEYTGALAQILPTVRPELTLAVAAGDRERFTWMAEKAVELGVSAIVPLETARTAGVATRLRDTHGAKLRRVVLEATKQCGAAWAPTVERSLALEQFLVGPIQGTGWLADPAGALPPATLDDAPLTVVIGPEGGFTTEERAALVSAGYRPVVLGANTLRFETAALAAAAVAGMARLRGNHG